MSGAQKRWISGTLYALPLVTVGVVCFALFVVAAPHPYPGARLYGGATLGVAHVSFRVEAVERLEELEAPLVARPIRVEADFGEERPAVWRGHLDALGMAHRLFVSRDPARDRRTCASRSTTPRTAAGRGRVALDGATWAKQAAQARRMVNGARRRRLSTSRSQLGKAYSRFLSKGPSAARASNVSRSRAHPSRRGDGLRVSNPRSGNRADGPQRPRTRDGESARARREPARDGEGPNGERGRASDVAVCRRPPRIARRNELRVASPIARDVLSSCSRIGVARLLGGSVSSPPDGRGSRSERSSCRASMRARSCGDSVDRSGLNSPGTVGWPLRPSAAGEPLRTWTVADALLLDGLVQSFTEDQQRKARARLLAGGFSAGAALLIILLMIGRVQSEDTILAAHLAEALPEVAQKDSSGRAETPSCCRGLHHARFHGHRARRHAPDLTRSIQSWSWSWSLSLSLSKRERAERERSRSMFGFQRLDIYQCAVQLLALSASLASARAEVRPLGHSADPEGLEERQRQASAITSTSTTT